jgi:hypothetical protein
MKKYILIILFLVGFLLIIFFGNIQNISKNYNLKKNPYLFFKNHNENYTISSVPCENSKAHLLYLYDKKIGKFTPIKINETIHKTKKIALLIYPSVDHNNAFNHRVCNKTFKKTQKDFHLFLAKPKSIQHLKNAISDFNKIYGLIDCLWIQGHGQKNNLKMNHGEFFNYKSLSKHSISLLHPNAKIFLDSCNTGKDGGLAQRLSLSARGRKIYAAKQKVYAKLVDFTNGEIKFKNLKRKNITVCYQNGINIA